MLFNFDTNANALEITLSEGLSARTIEIDSGTLVDVDQQGRVIAIEVIQPMRAWPLVEILDRFDIDAAAAAVLTSLWREDAPFPFAQPIRVAEPVA